ncbi:Hypothetical_protein [Hexamita inflata]|uniref:Hypothetical_protein n=1 Tax=Hexamita inflata TaxID=28002 RepID=A0AA86UQU6_9EUKA|nr:Hypothetical protein HINF_LOCUS48797 [Hexamita inflata]
MNYSLTQEGQKYDFDRIRPQSTIQSRYLIFQKGKIEITTCNKRTAMTKINAVEEFREGQLIHLTNLGSSEAFVFSSFLGPTDEFIKYCTNLNQLYHLFKIPCVISTFQSTKLIYERFYLENIWQLSLIEKRIRGSNDWYTDAICNLQLVAQALDLQRTSVFIFNWVNLNDFRYFLITKNNGGLFLSISTGSSR